MSLARLEVPLTRLQSLAATETMTYLSFTAPALGGGGIVRETLYYGTLGGVIGILIGVMFG